MARTASEPIVVAIDAGTTGVRCAAVDASGTIVAYRYREFAQHFPHEGWVEHDAIEIWDAVRSTLTQLCAALSRPIAAVGITNQRETVVAWDARTGRPRHRAIVWQDRRTAATCGRLRDAGHEPLIRARTGLVLDPYFSATKAAWLLTDGGVDDDAHLRLGTIDTWLVWNLTGGRAHVTDVSNASRTSLYDIVNRRWDDELCELFAVPRRALADVRPSSGRVGVTVSGNGVAAGVPISGIAGDQQAALFGQACFTAGMAKNTYGTGSFILLNAGTRCPAPTPGMLTTVAWQLGDNDPVYATEGAVFVTGAAIGWMRDQLGLISTSAEIADLAGSVDDSGGMMLVPAFTGLGSPWWDPYARGTLIGISRGCGRAQLARAVVESIALQCRDVLDAMTAATGTTPRALRVDGGASVMDLLLQIQADQLGVRVERPAVQETTALGAAFLAGLAEGVWGDTGDITRCWQLQQAFAPRADRSAADALHARWQRALERSRAWAES